ncbi:aspartate kinase [Salinicoccus jeotgali]|uniref:Aspartokinase n=1 Tax=Salinicoccus jeotgali TaxID=381634 RepID=A0ABP7EX39_9STAP
MDAKVLKFGGSSVGGFDKIRIIAEQLQERIQSGEKLIVVVSAMGRTTDELLTNINTLSSAPKEDHVALLLTTGEQQTISYLSIILENLGVRTKAMTGYQAGIKTFGGHMKSRIANIDQHAIESSLASYDVVVIAGFQGVNGEGEITTLGRGGSDTTAVALAARCNIPCEIYTDVEGLYATDPRLYSAASRIYEINYDEMMEMSALGAGVLETRCIEIAKNHSIPLYLGQTSSEKKGTWIMQETEIIERKAVTGIALDSNMMHVTLYEPRQDSTLIFDLFKQFDSHEVNIDMISQVINSGGFQLSFTVKGTDALQLHEILESIEEMHREMVTEVRTDRAKVSIIGSGMRDMTGVASKAFISLHQSDIPFYQTTTSEISISYVIDKKNETRAVEMLAGKFNI